MSQLLAAMLVLGGITLILGVLLAWASRAFYVYEDPRLDVIDGMLPQANCGACGQPGCRAFAEALLAHTTVPAKCTVSDEAGHLRIASFLNIDAGQADRHVARLACAGGLNAAFQHAVYKGLSTCRAAAAVGAGGKSCAWGCLGVGDCQVACDFDAIKLSQFRLPIVDESTCTACGDCVEICPKDLFSLQPVDDKLWVACKSQESGDAVLAVCEVGCTACGRCAMDAPHGLIRMEQELPVVQSRNHVRQPIERCPTGSIVWIGRNGPETGLDAPKHSRKEALPLAPL